MHLIVDGSGGDPDRLKDADLVNRFLDEHPGAIGMTKIGPPQVQTYHGRTAEDSGVSGFVLIAESHISIHTFPDRGFVYVDIFSCKDFDTAGSTRDVKVTFSLDDVRVRILDRDVDHATFRGSSRDMARERVGLGSPRGLGDA